MQCGSGITSINHAAWQIALGYADVAVAGGMESHSTRPAFMSTTTAPFKGMPPQWLKMRLSPVDEQDIPMLEVSDEMAKKWGITEWMQIHGDKYMSQLFGCDLCMSFWTCLVLSLALVIVNSDPWMIITAIPATPLTRMLV
jgi:hypothetical protein